MIKSLGKVLVVDDEKNITFVIQAMLEKAGYEALVFNDSKLALSKIDELHDELDCVITDLYMPNLSGMELLERVQNSFSYLPVVIITAFGTVESAVSALKRGAFDFITKPFDQTELLNVVQKAVQTLRQREMEPTAAEGGLSVSGAPSVSVSSIIGNSEQMQEIFKVITKIAQSTSTVMVWGESGTGKELVAYEIHRNSKRAQKPFIKINCAAIPATLIESEFFGYERGAFTGAVASKPGRFELAHEGTFFLDEVAEMPLEMQVKLLRVLQEQEFERVGGVNTIRVDVRIIAATNKELEAEVKAGRFREDLYYRLNVVPIHLPPLRERREDIDLLVGYFLKQFNERLKKGIVSITSDAMSALRSYRWPGNIRQLENMLERMILMSDGQVLDVEDLPMEISVNLGSQSSLASGASDGANPSPNFKELVKRQTQSVERDLIIKALEETSGNVTRAAENLGLSRKGLQIKMKELGVRR